MILQLIALLISAAAVAFVTFVIGYALVLGENPFKTARRVLRGIKRQFLNR